VTTAKRWSRRTTAIALAAIALVAGGTVAGVVATSGGTPFERAPKPVLGRSLRPLEVYERAPIGTTTVGRGQRAVPIQGGLPQTPPIIVERRPVIALSVDYARVLPSADGWRISFAAPESDVFNQHSGYGHAFVLLIGGKATYVEFWPYWGVNYLIGVRDEWPRLADALALARSWTTSVTVARCTQAQITKYRCT
jgi:hypothetical protein